MVNSYFSRQHSIRDCRQKREINSGCVVAQLTSHHNSTSPNSQVSPATDSMSDCSVTGWGLTVVEPDLVLVRLTGDSRAPGLPPAMGESDMVEWSDWSFGYEILSGRDC